MIITLFSLLAIHSNYFYLFSFFFFACAVLQCLILTYDLELGIYAIEGAVCGSLLLSSDFTARVVSGSGFNPRFESHHLSVGYFRQEFEAFLLILGGNYVLLC